MAIVSLYEAKEFANITTSANDAELQFFVEAASEAVEEHLGQVVGPRTFVEDVSGPVAFLRHLPVVSVTSASSAGVLLPDGSVSVNSVTGQVFGLAAATTLTRVTYVAGLADVPARVRLATLIITAHLWESQRSVGVGPGVGGFDDGAGPSVSLAYALPNRALELLGGRAPNRP